MKSFIFAIIGVLFVAGASFMGSAPGLDNRTAFLQSVAVDTITNAEKDTIAIGATFLTNYQLNVSAVRTSISGTHNVKLYLDESGTSTGNTDWRVIDSTSATTATVGVIRQSTMYARRFRIRVSGTGTQSSKYKIDVTAKPI